MNPQIFGWQHILILVISIGIIVSTTILLKKYVKNEKTLDIVIKSIAGALLVALITNRLSIVFKYDTPEWERIIPDSFCGMSSLVLSLSTLLGKKDNNVLHFVWFMALLGGSVTMIYPDFIGQSSSVLYLPTSSGLLHHIIAVYLVILLLTFGYIKPTYKKWYCTLFGFTTYIAIGTFEMSVLGLSDAFYIHKPILSGTPMTVWVLIPMYIALYGGTLAIIEWVRIRKSKKLAPSQDEIPNKDK